MMGRGKEEEGEKEVKDKEVEEVVEEEEVRRKSRGKEGAMTQTVLSIPRKFPRIHHHINLANKFVLPHSW